MNNIRIGLGEDIHRLVEGRPLVLGGVEIPFEKGLLAHSDGDVIYHAVCDALLGALALGDIGKYFRTDDPEWENAPSKLIVKEVVKMIEDRGYHVGNVDVTIACEQPHLGHHVEAMRVNLAFLLHVDATCVGIQAMTNEGMDSVGRGEAIRANAVVLLERANGEEQVWTTKKN